jgi:hypothetical protein
MPRDPDLAREPTEAQKRKMARPLVLDFTDVPLPSARYPKNRELKMTPRQIRARARRKGKMSKLEYETLYKPVEEWDEEELARGRPRNKAGDFRGPAPQWLTREVYEAALTRFKQIVQMEVRAEGQVAMGVIRNIMNDETLDTRGRYRTNPSTRLAAAQLMLEHIIGKPVQHVEQDISVRLQAVLANATVGPGAMHTDTDLEAIARQQYEAAYGELTTGSVMRPSSEDPYQVDEAEVVDDDA